MICLFLYIHPIINILYIVYLIACLLENTNHLNIHVNYRQGDDIDMALAELDEDELAKVKTAVKPKPPPITSRRKKAGKDNAYDYKQTIANLGSSSIYVMCSGLSSSAI